MGSRTDGTRMEKDAADTERGAAKHYRCKESQQIAGEKKH